MDAKKIVEIKGLSFSYSKNKVLENINLDINENDFVGIVGPNGGGKTTLVKIILALLKADKGKITVFNSDPEKVRSKISYVPQFGSMDRSFPIKAKYVVEMGLCDKKSFWLTIKQNKAEAVNEIMKELKINDVADTPFNELSGGIQQRVLIARALVSKPELLILDEATASIESSAEVDFYNMLKKLNDSITIILVSHDIGFISSYVNKIVCVNRELVCHPVGKTITDDLFSNIYKGKYSAINHKHKL